MLKLSTFTFSLLLLTACGENTQTQKTSQTSQTYNLQDIATQSASYTFNVASGIIEGNYTQEVSQESNRSTLMVSETTISQKLLDLQYSIKNVNSIDKNGNLTKSIADDGVICELSNEVDPMPQSVTLPAHSKITRIYKCNDGTSYTSSWQLKEVEGTVVYIITKKMEDNTNSSTTAFTLDDSSNITNIAATSTFKGIEYTLNATKK